MFYIYMASSAPKALRVRVAKNLLMRFRGVFVGRRKPAHAARIHVRILGVAKDKISQKYPNISQNDPKLSIYIYISVGFFVDFPDSRPRRVETRAGKP